MFEKIIIIISLFLINIPLFNKNKINQYINIYNQNNGVKQNKNTNLKEQIKVKKENNEILDIKENFSNTSKEQYNEEIYIENNNIDETNTINNEQIINNNETNNIFKYGVNIETNMIDYSTYNASTYELKQEAINLIKTNKEKINSIIYYVNTYRKEVGMQEVTEDYNLNLSATIRALEMGWSRIFSHTRPNGTEWYSVLNELNISEYTFGENIAIGYSESISVSNAWKNSSNHYSNIIDSNFKKIGVGYVNVNGQSYWVQIFSS